MEKNKSAHKLKGLPPIYVINLDDKEERWEYMEDQFKYWEIKNYQRVSAYDGRGDNDLGEILKGRYPDQMNSGEVGCVTSHLKAIQMFLETDAPCALIMEDDCDISTAFHWGFSWKDFYAKVPYDYDVIQLAIINPASITVQLHHRFVNDFSTACYMITRHHAEKLIKHHVKGPDKYRLDNGVKPRPVADDLIYNSGNTYSIPLLLYRLQLGSSIHPEHVDVFHKQNFDGIMNWWTQMGATMEVKTITDFDPYLGKVSDPSQHR